MPAVRHKAKARPRGGGAGASRCMKAASLLQFPAEEGGKGGGRRERGGRGTEEGRGKKGGRGGEGEGGRKQGRGEKGGERGGRLPYQLQNAPLAVHLCPKTIRCEVEVEGEAGGSVPHRPSGPPPLRLTPGQRHGVCATTTQRGAGNSGVKQLVARGAGNCSGAPAEAGSASPDCLPPRGAGVPRRSRAACRRLPHRQS